MKSKTERREIIKDMRKLLRWAEEAVTDEQLDLLRSWAYLLETNAQRLCPDRSEISNS